MPLDLPDGTPCFIDANIFYYHFVQTPGLSDKCTTFLERVAAGAIAGHTSVNVLSEAVHKVMLAEVAAKFGLDRAGLVNWLQRHRARITELSEFSAAADELGRMNLITEEGDIALLREAASLSATHGLLTNDALILATIRRLGLSHLVTNDEDFNGVGNLVVWKPR